MATSNPSHLLISRNPRSPAHPQLAPSTTSLYQPQPGPHLFTFPLSNRSANTSDTEGPVHQHQRSQSTPAFPFCDGNDEDSEDDDTDLIIHPTFRRDAALPGRVKVVVGRYEFWCHKEMLWFASPFFHSLLEGSWAETSVTTQLQPSSPTDTDTAGVDSTAVATLPEDTSASHRQVFAENTHLDATSEAPQGSDDARSTDDETAADPNCTNEQKASVYLDAEEDGPSVAEILRELRELPEAPHATVLEALHAPPAGVERDVHAAHSPRGSIERPRSAPTSSPSPPPASNAPALSPPLRLLPGGPQPCPPTVTAANVRRRGASNQSMPGGGVHTWPNAHRPTEDVKLDAVVEMHETSASAFQDFLFWAYPHLECKVTWTNVDVLLALANKLIVPALQKLCEHFLMTHASGQPIVALQLAEEHNKPELYREASRFALDQPSWETRDLESLSDATRIKLSMRRTWFLERLLKLGSIDVKKEYACRPECPDPLRCATQLDEKWRQAHQAVSRYGPPQPSVAFRCLRMLETFPTNPSLVMDHPLCQSAAKSWCATLFDRMFQPKMAFGALSPGTEKYWLYITLN